MSKRFCVTGTCIPAKNYMVDISGRVDMIIRDYIDKGQYFTINRARQYGKTTTLYMLEQRLKSDYLVISLSFEAVDEYFASLGTLAEGLMMDIAECLKNQNVSEPIIEEWNEPLSDKFPLRSLGIKITKLCKASNKKVVLMIDEVDKSSDNQIFLSFLGLLREKYLKCQQGKDITFQSVILAGVYDVKSLKLKIHPQEETKYNSPWNIAADFSIEMSFSESEIAGMLQEYEIDHRTGMNISKMSELLYAYTAGYPFLVSRICQLMDERVRDEYENLKLVWTENGFNEAVRILLAEKNPLFESLVGKICDYPELSVMLKTLLFTGRNIAYNPDETSIDMAQMFGFIKNQNGNVVIANRIFETRLYNYYLTEAKMQQTEIYKAALQDKSQFIVNGYLDMERILECFVVHFQDIYGESDEKFLEEQGRKFFLLYLKPIINGTGNYYIESRTRDLRRTDVIVDYHGRQYIIELKIWHGDEYNKRGEQQLVGYLEDYHVDKGYMLSFNFNRKKQSGIRKIIVNEKTIVEAVV